LRVNPFSKSNISFSANFSRNYRFPTLNDLYWENFGNPNLKAEQSLSAEAGVIANHASKNGAFFIESEITGYFSDITNYILWAPLPENGAKFLPVNIPEVFARGLELGLNTRWTVSKVTLAFNGNYNFCRSTNEKVPESLSGTVGKQIIYIPVNTANATLNAGYMKFFFSYNFFYTSRRYTSTANETYMPGYNLSNIFFGKNFGLKNFILTLQLEINNLFDLDYQSVASRPMPGINYGLTLKCNFKGKPGQ
jgi:outer membrane cobalamin receptor